MLHPGDINNFSLSLEKCTLLWHKNVDTSFLHLSNVSLAPSKRFLAAETLSLAVDIRLVFVSAATSYLFILNFSSACSGPTP